MKYFCQVDIGQVGKIENFSLIDDVINFRSKDDTLVDCLRHLYEVDKLFSMIIFEDRDLFRLHCPSSRIIYMDEVWVNSEKFKRLEMKLFISDKSTSSFYPDAVCECGHLRTQHSPVLGADLSDKKLHYGCMHRECKCKKFKIK